ncbi:MAG: FAD-dependent monooxygenase [Pseudorhodoferax sp.]
MFDVVLRAPVDLPDHTVQHCDPRRPMTYCNVVGARRRWEIMVLPEDDRAALLQPETLWRLVAPWVTPEQAQLERAAIYTFHSVIAEGWRAGRLFLAGDACHQTPPFLGQGMCAGIRDAANLAWKLDAVLAGPRARCAAGHLRVRAQAPCARADRAGRAPGRHHPDHRRRRGRRARRALRRRPARGLRTAAAAAGRGRLRSRGRPWPAGRSRSRGWRDGRLLDELLGRRSAVIGRRDALRAAAPATAERWRRSDAIVIDQPEPGIDAWLDAHGAQAVILRPDRYIVGVARTGPELDRISQYLPVAP